VQRPMEGVGAHTVQEEAHTVDIRYVLSPCPLPLPLCGLGCKWRNICPCSRGSG
jgi:hypothetical protein